MPSVRFQCPSASLTLKVLLKRARHAPWIALVLALGIHLSFTQLGGLGEQQKVAKPLTTQFIKRQPRLTKPLEMKKRPQPRRRRLQRTMVAVKAKVNRQQLTSQIQGLQVMRSLAKPKTYVGRSLTMGSMGLEPKTMAEALSGSMNPENVVDMSLEMVDIEALDTGRYQAMVIQDPSDKRRISGYFHLWMPWGQHYSDDGTLYDWPNLKKYAVRRLVLKLNEWTDIKADIKGIIGFDARELLETPWVVLSYWYRMYPTDVELENIGRYMHSGGFIYTEGGTLVIRDALEYGGSMEFKDWNWERLPHSHPIFHCYFDFPGGPPPGMVSIGYYVAAYGRAPDPPKIEAIEIDGHIAATRSNAGYVDCWGYVGKGGLPSPYDNHDPRRQLEFGVNTIIFALTQEGSITRRLMNSVR